MSTRLGIVGAALLSSLSCSSGGGGGGPALGVSPLTLTIAAGAAATSFTATQTGASAAISWSLTGPGTFSPATGTTTWYTPPQVVASTTTATLTATAGGLTVGATITINPPPVPSIAVSPKMLTVTAGAAAAPFTATLEGSSATISWSLTGPGTFSPATGSDTSYLPPPTVASVTTATLTAAAGSLTDSATIKINPPGTVTVTGTIRSHNGQPVVGAPVLIGTQTAVSDSKGEFTIDGVTTPYKLISVVNSPRKVGVVYVGLTRTDPNIIIFLGFNPTFPNTGRVSGNVTGGDPVGSAGENTYVAWGSPQTSSTFGGVTANYPYTIAVSWFGPTSTAGNVHALQFTYDTTTNLPITYKGYGMASNVAVTNGGTTMQNITMTAVAPANISGTVTVPASYSPFGTSMSLDFQDGATFPLAPVNGGIGLPPSSSFDYATPSGTGGTIHLGAGAATDVAESYVDMYGLAPDAAGVSLVVPEASVPGIPTDQASGITTDSDFTWTAFKDGIHLVYFFPEGQFATGPTYYVFTSATATKIPDLSAQGLGLPSGGVAYAWVISGLGPYSNTDALAGVANGSLIPSNATVFYQSNAVRSFTTK